MSPRETFALRDYLGPEWKGRTISDAHKVVLLTNIVSETCLVGRCDELAGRSVLLAVTDQLISAIAMTEIDGVARRMLLCPPDLNADHFNALIEDAEIDAIVTDQPARWADAEVYLVMAARAPVRGTAKAKIKRATEWLMLTSGTSGVPKIVSHTLDGLTGAIVADGPAQGTPPVWATFYDIRRYGGLQILLRAVIGGGLFLAACGLLSFGLGAVLRHTAAAITAAIGLLFVLTILTNFLPQSWQVHVDKWIPANAGSQIWTVVTDPTAHLFSAWVGFGVFVAYAAIAIGAGFILFRKRDA